MIYCDGALAGHYLPFTKAHFISPAKTLFHQFQLLFLWDQRGEKLKKTKKGRQQEISYVPTRAIPSFKKHLRTHSTQLRTISIKPKPTFLYFSLYGNFLCTSSYPVRGCFGHLDNSNSVTRTPSTSPQQAAVRTGDVGNNDRNLRMMTWAH